MLIRMHPIKAVPYLNTTLTTGTHPAINPILTVALQLGLPSSDLKLLSALLVIIAISASSLKKRGKKNVRTKEY